MECITSTFLQGERVFVNSGTKEGSRDDGMDNVPDIDGNSIVNDFGVDEGGFIRSMYVIVFGHFVPVTVIDSNIPG